MAAMVDIRRHQWLPSLLLLLLFFCSSFLVGFTTGMSMKNASVNIPWLAEGAPSLTPISLRRLIFHFKARIPIPPSICKPPHLLCGPPPHPPPSNRLLPHPLSRRLLPLLLHPHSLPLLLHILRIPPSSPLSLHMRHTLYLCRKSPPSNSTCATSLHHMTHFANSMLHSPHLRCLKPSFSTASHGGLHPMAITSVSAGPAVTCQQLPFPFAVFLCEAMAATTRTLEVEGEGWRGVVQCRGSEAREGCEWVRAGSLVWVVEEEEEAGEKWEGGWPWANQKLHINFNWIHNNFNNSGDAKFSTHTQRNSASSGGNGDEGGADNAKSGRPSNRNSAGSSNASSSDQTPASSNTSSSDQTPASSNTSSSDQTPASSNTSSSNQTPASSSDQTPASSSDHTPASDNSGSTPPTRITSSPAKTTAGST